MPYLTPQEHAKLNQDLLKQDDLIEKLREENGDLLDALMNIATAEVMGVDEMEPAYVLSLCQDIARAAITKAQGK